MPIPVTCPGCGTSMNAPDQYAGRRGKCRNCGSAVMIPAATSTDLVIQAPANRAGVVETKASPLPTVREVRDATPLATRTAPPAPAPAPIPVAVVSRSPAEPESMACPFCGESILKAAVKCKHCGEFLDPALRAKAEKATPQATPQPQVVIHNTNTVAAGYHLAPERWNRATAFLMSIIPGLGQFYKGQWINAVVWFLLVAACYGGAVGVGAFVHLLCALGAASGNTRA